MTTIENLEQDINLIKDSLNNIKKESKQLKSKMFSTKKRLNELDKAKNLILGIKPIKKEKKKNVN